MSAKWRLGLLVALLAGCGVAVYYGSLDQPAGFSSVLEIWGDVLRDADQIGLRFTRVSDADEMQLGRNLAAASPWGRREAAEWQPYVTAVGETLLPFARRQGIRYQFHVVDLSSPNAFALPGGQVYITTAMLEFLETEAELAAILGHEISHVDLRHCVERYQYLLKLEKLHVAPAGEMVEFFRSLASIEYQKYQEQEADAQGLRLSIQSGYDPAAGVTVFRRFEQRFGPAAPPAPARSPVGELTRAAGDALAAYFRSHPPAQERAARLAEQMRRRQGTLAGRKLYQGRENYQRRIAKSRQQFTE